MNKNITGSFDSAIGSSLSSQPKSSASIELKLVKNKPIEAFDVSSFQNLINSQKHKILNERQTFNHVRNNFEYDNELPLLVRFPGDDRFHRAILVNDTAMILTDYQEIEDLAENYEYYDITKFPILQNFKMHKINLKNPLKLNKNVHQILLYLQKLEIEFETVKGEIERL